MYKKLIWLIALKTLVILLFILYGGVGLGPDEAQYWTWSEALAPGYYSKPSGIAFQVLLGTSLFGSTELGVRFGSLLIGAIMPFLIYKLARTSGLEERESFWSAIIWAFSPLGFAGSFLAITDVGMILFWTLSGIVLLSQGPGLLLGVMVGLGALFKWPMYFFWIFALWGEAKGQSLKKWLLAIGVSLLALIPSFIWNASHNFVTFRHVEATLQGGSGVKAAGNFWEFLGSQVALISPIFFLLMVLAYRYWPTTRSFTRVTSLPSMIFGMVLSLFMKVQGNWGIWAFPTIAVTAGEASQHYPKLKKWGLALSLLLILLVPIFVPFKHNVGWDKLPSALTQAGYDPQQHFLFSDKYQNSSIMSFYSPGQKRAYFLNLRGDRLNQFSFWPSMKEERLGQDGYFMTTDAVTPDLAPYFESVEKIGVYPLAAKKMASIYKGKNYNGNEPDLSKKY